MPNAIQSLAKPAALAALLSGAVAPLAFAQEISADASNVLCSVSEMKRCEFEAVCVRTERDYVEAPAFIAMDLAAMTAEGDGPGGIGEVNEIAARSQTERSLIVQLVVAKSEAGRSESAVGIAVDKATGRGVVTAAAPTQALIGSVNCTER
jgi:hypothetical protein